MGSLCTLPDGVDTALESTLDALMTATLLSTTLCSLLATALTLPRAITGMGGTAGDPAGARVATSGWPGTLRPSAAPTRPQWTALPVLEAPAMMSSTCAASVASSSMSLGLLAPTTLPCLELFKLFKALNFCSIKLRLLENSFLCLLSNTSLLCLEQILKEAVTFDLFLTSP